MERLNLNLLRSLAVLLEERNVTQASQRLHLTQSAMSRQLGQIRDYFQDPLLIREGNDYLLSSQAKQLLPKVQSILSRIDELKDEERFDPTACHRRFSFACTDYVAQFIFPNILRRLQLEAPGIDIVYEMWKPKWLSRLGQRPLDFVSTTITQLPENVQSIYLGQDNPVCLMATDHPLAQQNAPTLSALLEYPFAHISSGGDKDSFFDKALESDHLQRRILFEVPFFSAAFQVVASSQTLMVLPTHVAHNAGLHFPVTFKPLPLATPKNHYHLCWHALHEQDPAHTWLRNVIAEELKSSMYSPSSS